MGDLHDTQKGATGCPSLVRGGSSDMQAVGGACWEARSSMVGERDKRAEAHIEAAARPSHLYGLSESQREAHAGQRGGKVLPGFMFLP